MSYSEEVFMARQPIYNGKQELVAYELLYRPSLENSAGVMGSAESSKSLVTALIDIGLGTLVGAQPAFINMDQEMLLSDSVSLLPADRVVLELLETVKATPETVDKLSYLQKEGYQIALDDFVQNPHTRAFLPYAKIIKLEVQGDQNQLEELAMKLKRPGLEFLAEKVETRAQFELCRRLGFSYFQGYFFSKPEIIRGKTIGTNKLNTIRMLARLQDPNLEISELEELISSDLSLTHRLLKLVRSAQFGLRSDFNSIRQAVVFLGFKSISTIASLLVMSGSSDKPQDLIVTSLARAKTCEELAKMRSSSEPSRFYTAGLLSVIDAILNVPMDVLLEELPLDEEMNRALMGEDSKNLLSAALLGAIAFEQGNWELGDEFHVSEVNSAYLTAVRYAFELNLSLISSAA